MTPYNAKADTLPNRSGTKLGCQHGRASAMRRLKAAINWRGGEKGKKKGKKDSGTRRGSLSTTSSYSSPASSLRNVKETRHQPEIFKQTCPPLSVRGSSRFHSWDSASHRSIFLSRFLGPLQIATLETLKGWFAYIRPHCVLQGPCDFIIHLLSLSIQLLYKTQLLAHLDYQRLIVLIYSLLLF